MAPPVVALEHLGPRALLEMYESNTPRRTSEMFQRIGPGPDPGPRHISTRRTSLSDQPPSSTPTTPRRGSLTTPRPGSAKDDVAARHASILGHGGDVFKGFEDLQKEHQEFTKFEKGVAYQLQTNIPVGKFFDGKGVLARKAPPSWAVVASSHGQPLSKTRHTEEHHGSLSTRQQLMNTQFTLEQAKKKVEEQIVSSLLVHQAESQESADAQHLRHLKLLFHPLRRLPENRMFKVRLRTTYIDEDNDVNVGAEDPTRQESLDEVISKGVNNSFNLHTRGRRNSSSNPVRRGTLVSNSKGSGGAMTNEQRAMLLAVFKRYILRVSSSDARSALMKRCTWFRFLAHCQLIGPHDSWDVEKPEEMRITFVSAAKIFSIFAEAANIPPALTFSGWVNAAQAVLRSQGHYQTSSEVVNALFDILLPRAQLMFGITPEDARRQALQISKKEGRKQSMSSGSRGTITHIVGQKSRNDAPRSTTSRAMSFMSGSGSIFAADETVEEEKGPDDDKVPLPWQKILAEEEMCEPECLQLLHEYIYLLKALFKYYRAKDVADRGESPSNSRSASQQSSRRPSEQKSERPVPAMLTLPDGGVVEDAEKGAETEERNFGELFRNLSGTPTELNRDPPSPVPEHHTTSSRKEITPEGMKRMLIELRFYPDFVQNFALARHIFFTQVRHNCDNLGFSAFVECLCRIAFVYLAAYGNSQQQAAPAKHKALWLLCQLEARLPEELKIKKTDSRAMSALDDRFESLWERNVDFDLSQCPTDQLVLAQTMMDKPIERAATSQLRNRSNSCASSTITDQVERLLSQVGESPSAQTGRSP